MVASQVACESEMNYTCKLADMLGVSLVSFPKVALLNP